MFLTSGTLLQGGKYRIVRVLGQGGFGITYEAEQVSLGRTVAIKEFFLKNCCHREVDASQVSVPTPSTRELVEKFKGKFLREARMIASFDSPHIVRIVDVFEENGTAYYVMANLPGGSLKDKVEVDGPMSEPVAEKYIRQVADALAYVHGKNTLHLDVKPANILLNAKGEAVLIDFGISKHYDEASEQTSTTPVGISQGYSPKEQQRACEVSHFNPATDIYALGATLYTLVTGAIPPEALIIDEEGLARPEGLSDRIWQTIEKSMAPRRKDRPQSIDAFLALLDAPDQPVPGPGANTGGNQGAPDDNGSNENPGEGGDQGDPEMTEVDPDGGQDSPNSQGPSGPQPKPNPFWKSKTFRGVLIALFLAIGAAAVWYYLEKERQEQIEVAREQAIRDSIEKARIDSVAKAEAKAKAKAAEEARNKAIRDSIMAALQARNDSIAKAFRDSLEAERKAKEKEKEDEEARKKAEADRKAKEKAEAERKAMEAQPTKDLSLNRSANCYIISAPGKYVFRTVKGNSSASVGSVSKADVLWESSGKNTAPNNGDIIARVSYNPSSDYITLYTPFNKLKNGNAVIAAKDASGTILWSWHIWVCRDYNPTSFAQTYYNNTKNMMDRNLGATSATPGDVGARGLLYQWGRKDPFPCRSFVSASTTGSWHIQESTPSNTIEYAVAHPTTFIKGEEGTNYDWVYSSRNDTLWQSSKTIYDPCPPGWRIPDGGSSGVWSKAVGCALEKVDTIEVSGYKLFVRGSMTIKEKFTQEYDSSKKGMNFSGQLGSAETIWYPAVGWLGCSTAWLCDVGDSGRWWSCTPNGNTVYGFGLDSDSTVQPLNGHYYRANGFSVRCVQE